MVAILNYYLENLFFINVIGGARVMVGVCGAVIDGVKRRERAWAATGLGINLIS